MGRIDLASPSAAARLQGGWLYGRRIDLTLVLLPAVVTALAFAITPALGTAGQAGPIDYAVWLSQYILGNTTHVVLTFFLLGVRRDLLHTTPRQARVVTWGGAAAFAALLAFYLFTSVVVPEARSFALVVTTVFALHHTFSQVKGYWALYGLRAARDGIGRIGDEERRLQQLFVPLALLLVALRWMFVPVFDDPRAPAHVHMLAGEPAVLPFWMTHALVLVWVGYTIAVLRAAGRGPVVHGARLLYLATHLVAVLLLLVAIPWGSALSAGLHGMEYYFITARMMEPTADDAGSRVTRAAVWPVMIAGMLPVLVLGVLRGPWPARIGPAALSAYVSLAGTVFSAVTMTHYFVDAFIYRFRIPEVRAVALRRLGLAG